LNNFQQLNILQMTCLHYDAKVNSFLGICVWLDKRCTGQC